MVFARQPAIACHSACHAVDPRRSNGGRALRGLLEPGRIQWRSGALLDSLVAAELEVLLGSRWVGGRWLWC